jgi:hypothetical protein
LSEEFAAKFSSRSLVKGLRRSLAKLLDGGFEAGEKGFAGFATIEMLFQLCAERIGEEIITNRFSQALHLANRFG